VRAAVDRRSVLVRNALRRRVRSFLPTTVIRRRRRRVHMWYGRAGACVRGRRSILLCSAVVRPRPKGEDGCNNDGAGRRGGGDERVPSAAEVRAREASTAPVQRRRRRPCDVFVSACESYLFIFFSSTSSTAKRPLVIFDRSARF